jgi:hypothetical protein
VRGGCGETKCERGEECRATGADDFFWIHESPERLWLGENVPASPALFRAPLVGGYAKFMREKFSSIADYFRPNQNTS